MQRISDLSVCEKGWLRPCALMSLTLLLAISMPARADDVADEKPEGEEEGVSAEAPKEAAAEETATAAEETATAAEETAPKAENEAAAEETAPKAENEAAAEETVPKAEKEAAAEGDAAEADVVDADPEKADGVEEAEEEARVEVIEETPVVDKSVAQTSKVEGSGDYVAALESPIAHASVAIMPFVGVTVPQLFSDLGSYPTMGLEVGFILPVDVASFVRPIQLGLDVHYTAPGSSGSGFNPNLGEDGASYDWDLNQRMLVVGLTGLWRFMPLGQFFNAYALVGPRLYMMESILNASGADNDFGENRETSTKVGFVVGTGLDLAVGPGSLAAALKFSMSGLDGRITGDSNTGALVLDLGYRLYF